MKATMAVFGFEGLRIMLYFTCRSKAKDTSGAVSLLLSKHLPMQSYELHM